MPITKCLRGVNGVTVDTKGRVGIPSRYRQDLHNLCKGHLVVTADLSDKAILIFPKPNWLPVEKQLQNLSSTRIERYIQRRTLAHASECELDSNGRILLPPPLRKDMGIKKQCVLLGQGSRFELWDQKIWDNYSEQRIKEIDKQEINSVLKDFNL